MMGEDSGAEMDFWLDAAEGKLKKGDWVKHFEGRGYRASVDAPSAMFYRYEKENLSRVSIRRFDCFFIFNLPRQVELLMLYRVIRQLSDYALLTFIWQLRTVIDAWALYMPTLPDFHLPKQNLADTTISR